MTVHISQSDLPADWASRTQPVDLRSLPIRTGPGVNTKDVLTSIGELNRRKLETLIPTRLPVVMMLQGRRISTDDIKRLLLSPRLTPT